MEYSFQILTYSLIATITELFQRAYFWRTSTASFQPLIIVVFNSSLIQIDGVANGSRN